MLSPIILAALCALALLVVASVRRVPEGHVYTFILVDANVNEIARDQQDRRPRRYRKGY